MRIVLCLLLILSVTGFFSMIVILILQRNEKISLVKKLLVVGGVLLLVLTQLPTWRNITGLYTTTIYVHNGNKSQVLSLTLNGKTYGAKAHQLAILNTANYSNDLQIKLGNELIDTTLSSGCYIINSYTKKGTCYALSLRERGYRSLKGDFDNLDSDLFHQRLDNIIVQLDEDNEKCIINTLGKKLPNYMNKKHKGKRLFEARPVSFYYNGN